MRIAQSLQIPGVTGTIEGPKGVGAKFTNLASVINQAVPILFAFAGIALFAYLVWGGFDFLTSMGDPKKAEAGKNKITSAVIGFIIIFAAFWILQIVDVFFGFKIF